MTCSTAHPAPEKDQPELYFPDDEQLARVTETPADASACATAAEQNPTANARAFSQIAKGDRFCLVTSDAHFVYLHVTGISKGDHDIRWTATTWSPS
ncbi:hypothetical protein ACFC4G_45320 [Streptomyces sp. NPDC056002]|uniref:hypothetical protein n=1 Tax=Streptomyces sp. NPDC056002 TaxID=3345675 RepID=UPI0035DA2D7B